MSLRVVVGGMCAVAVGVVAMVTLLITLSVSLETVRGIGRDRAISLVNNARSQVENYFDLPTRHLELLQRVTSGNGPDFVTKLPSEEDVGTWHEKWFTLLTHISVLSNYTYHIVGVIFDEGSAVSANVPPPPFNTFLALNAGNAVSLSESNPNTTHTSQGIVLSDFSMFAPLPSEFSFLTTDSRIAAYVGARVVAGDNRVGFLFSPEAYLTSIDPPQSNLLFPLVAPLYNSTASFLGLVTTTISLDTLSDFFRELDGTPGTYAFALDGEGYLVGSSHPDPFITVTSTTDANADLPHGGCSSTARTTTATFPVYFIMCRTNADTFSYAPLRATAGDPEFLRSPVQRVSTRDVEGENYHIAATPVSSRVRLFNIRLVLVIPESETLGNIVMGRNIAVGVTVGVCVLTAVGSFVLVYWLLNPLRSVAQRMYQTASLDEGEDDPKEQSFSHLQEISLLQEAYNTMDTAIRSFTRYVPRSVVKDLLISGQLCTIRMDATQCTVLFMDIAGFTSMCERVPPAKLSQLVSQYFETMTGLVLRHDGTVDKFIGDCIMAMWGAPRVVSNAEVKASLCGVLLNRETMVEPLCEAFESEGERLSVRVGISSGQVLAGNMGSAARMNYTVIGDTVNLASRLESLNKQFGTHVMVSESVVTDDVRRLFVLRLVMNIAVVGKEQPVRVYEPLGLVPDVSSQDLEPLAVCDGEATRTARVMSARAGTSHMKLTSALPTPELLISASALPGVACDETEVHYAAMFTSVVEHYMLGQFGNALQTIASMRSTLPSRVFARRGGTDRPLERLSNLCTEALCNPSGVERSGIYRSDTK